MDPLSFLTFYLHFMYAHPILLLSLILFTSCFHAHYKRGLRSLPGPFIASITNFWRIYHIFKARMPQEEIALHENYGPIVRIGPNHVSVSDAESLKEVYGARSEFLKVRFLDLYSFA